MNMGSSADEIKGIIAYSKEEAMRTGNYEITPDLLVLGILRHHDNKAYELLEELNIPRHILKREINEYVSQGDEMVPYDLESTITFSEDSLKVLELMRKEADRLSNMEVSSLHMLLAIYELNVGYAFNKLHDLGLTIHNIVRKIEANFRASNDGIFADSYSADMEEEEDFMHENGKDNPTPNIDKYGFDLTKAAYDGNLDPVVGREDEIRRVAQILGRRKKNNPILVGEAGVGKSAIVEGLAIKIANRDVSRALMDKRIISLDMGSVVAGTKFRGQFEERIKAILSEIKVNPNIILFIDEIHTIVGAGGAVGSLDAANLLKPALARGEIQCIGATTLDEFREIIEKDSALERRFQKVLIEPTSFEETLDILYGIKKYYEDYHEVEYSDDAIAACINLSVRYISDRQLPDKAIDIMDEAGSKAHLKGSKVPETIYELEHQLKSIRNKKKSAVRDNDFNLSASLWQKEKKLANELDKVKMEWDTSIGKRVSRVGVDNIAEVVSMMTGIPVNKIASSESNRLLNMSQTLKRQIIGQDEAVEKVVKAIQRNRAGIKDPTKPIGTFLFFGPTGVGKTQLAKVLADFMFGSVDNLIRIDMSEYMEKFAVSRLIGAPPGYVGYGEGGQLSERVRRKPYSVVLLDEIEKAHPDIFNILLQVLDEGRLTDSNGRQIDFRNTVLILTSNVGSRELKSFGEGVGYSNTTKKDTSSKSRMIIDKAIEKTFAPEFLNRLDEQVLFNSLTKSDIEVIIDIELKGLYKRIKELGYNLVIDKKAKDFIADLGYDPRYGARPLKRAIQKYVEDPVAEAIIGHKKNRGTIRIKLNKEANNTVAELQDDVVKNLKKKAVVAKS